MSAHPPDRARLVRATAVMTLGTALSRATGLLRVAALASALGVAGTRLADTYNLANTTPNIIYELFLGGVFTSVYVRELVGSRDRDRSPLISVSLLLLAGVSALAAAGAPLLVRLYTWRIPDPHTRRLQQEVATDLLRWFSPQIFFYGLSAIAQALLNARRRFGPPMFAPVLNNLAVVAMFASFAAVFGRRSLEDLGGGGVVLLGAGTTAGVALQALVLVPLLRGERLRPVFRFSDPSVRRVLGLARYVVGYVATNQVGLWVVLALANRQPGAVTAYQIAFLFFQLPHGLFAVSFITALQPELAEAAAAADLARFRSLVRTGLRGIAFLLLPAAVGYALLAHPVARLIVAHGVAGRADAARVAEVLVAFSGGLVFFSAFQLLRTACNALPDTRTPFLVNLATTAVWIGANVPLFARLGARGLALGHALSYVFGSLVLGAALARRVGGLGVRALAGHLARTAAAAAGMGAALWGLGAATGWAGRTSSAADAASVAAGVGAGTILYLAFSQVMRVAGRDVVGMALRRSRGEDGLG